jgi:CRISPR-associated protein Csd1
MEVTMSLNTENSTPAYLLGRLFAILEKVQQEAVKSKITIKDRYFGAASATPQSVFPQLLRLAQHHIQKAEWGNASDRRVGEIVERLESFPAHLTLEQQGIFVLGYYQQKNAFYITRNERESQ